MIMISNSHLIIYFTSEIILSKARYEGGLGRLDGTQQEVSEMQDTLKRLQPLLVTSAQDVQKILATVEKESAEVAEIEKVMRVDEEAAMVFYFNISFNYFNIFVFLTYLVYILRRKWQLKQLK